MNCIICQREGTHQGSNTCKTCQRMPTVKFNKAIIKYYNDLWKGAVSGGGLRKQLCEYVDWLNRNGYIDAETMDVIYGEPLAVDEYLKTIDSNK